MKKIIIATLCLLASACSPKDTSRNPLLPYGRVTAFWEGTEKPMYEKEWRKKNPHGKWKEFYESGKVAQTYEFDNGKKVGTWTRWYENGKVASQGNYVNDKEDGVWIGYHENGKKAFEGMYRNGLKEGKHVAYAQDGAITQQIIFKDGEPVSAD
jgi:antitoxin component YwqK of YwqJK toxin-antitoxin module